MYLPSITANTVHAAADGIDQYHDDVLDYMRFALRLSHADIPRLPQILAGVSVQRRAELQQVWPCHCCRVSLAPVVGTAPLNRSALQGCNQLFVHCLRSVGVIAGLDPGAPSLQLGAGAIR